MTSFRRYILRRFFLGVVTILGTVVAVFVLTFIVPGDVAYLKLGPTPAEDQLAKVRHDMGTDQPIPVQFVKYMGKLARGDLGMSWISGRPVSTELGQRFPATVELALAAVMVSVVVGYTLGVVAAIKRNSIVDQAIRSYAILGASTAVFWLALVLIYFFYFRLSWAPAPMGRLSVGMEPPPSITKLYLLDSLLAGNLAVFRDCLAHLALPALTLGFVLSAPISKIVRAAMLDVLRSDFVRTARAIGVPYREIIVRDGLRNAMMPVLTSIGFALGNLVAGNVIVEQIFAWPGIGQYAWLSLTTNDFEALRAFILVIALLYVAINLVIDLLYSVIDPRIRLG